MDVVRLKRTLRPLRPVLGPVWNLFRRSTGQAARPPSWPSPPRTGRRSAHAGDEVLIYPMTREQFVALRADDPYYADREQYMAAAARTAGHLISRHQLVSALELGPYRQPIVTGSDVIELRPPSGLRGARRLIVHDATSVPWPFNDRTYDLFVALQVFEHLDGHQRAVFKEVCRIARHAVISVPIDWEMRDPTNCHHMISRETALSWFAPRVPTRILQGNPAPKSRLIFVFENLDKR
jgi:hypothetical protein